MTLGPAREAELSDLINALCEESIAPKQMARLEELLLADPASQELYMHLILIHSKLLLEFGGSVLDLGGHCEMASHQKRADDGVTTGPPLVSRHQAAPNRVARRLSWARSAAACFMALLAGGLMMSTRLAATRFQTAQTVASLVEAGHVVWADGQTPLAVGARLAPGDIHCLSGTLKLVFDAGALVTLEGPADLRVLSGMRIRADRGRITTRIEGRAKGFAIEAPNTLVVDQGTEFGVEIDDAGRTGVLVFEGEVYLSRPGTAAGPEPVKRLFQGEGIRTVGREGHLSRIVSVERRPGNDAWSTGPLAGRDIVIRSVRDNIRGLESSKYYEIVRRGLDDDVLAYVDRSHQWNGLDPERGLPGFLRGADYIMPFNDDRRMTDLRVTVELASPATLYVFFDDRAQLPPWLTDRFTDTGVDIGLDVGPVYGEDKSSIKWGHGLSVKRGPGVSIDSIFSVWKRDAEPGEPVELGALMAGAGKGMYGIAAVARP